MIFRLMGLWQWGEVATQKGATLTRITVNKVTRNCASAAHKPTHPFFSF
jgi:hypothetical protein